MDWKGEFLPRDAESRTQSYRHMQAKNVHPVFNIFLVETTVRSHRDIMMYAW